MPWSTIIPTSLLYLGGLLLTLAVVLVFVDVPGKGVPWDKVAAWFAIIGGFGIGGAAAGSIGRAFSTGANSVIASSTNFTAGALGVTAVGAIVVGVVLWAYSRAQGKGIGTKSKFKSLVVVAVLGVVGTIISAIFPGFYGVVDQAVAWAGTTLITALS